MKNFEMLENVSAYVISRDSNANNYYFKTGKGVKLSKEEREKLTDELHEIGGVYNGTRHAWFFSEDPYLAIQAALGRRPMPDLTGMLAWRDEQMAKRQKSAKAATGEFSKQLETLYGLVADTVKHIDNSRMANAVSGIDLNSFSNSKADIATCKHKVKAMLETIAGEQFAVDEEDVNAVIYGIYQKFQKKSAIRAEKDWYAVSLASFKSAVRAYIWDRVNNVKAAEAMRKESSEMAA